jgi:hypothetical protein
MTVTPSKVKTTSRTRMPTKRTLAADLDRIIASICSFHPIAAESRATPDDGTLRAVKTAVKGESQLE